MVYVHVPFLCPVLSSFFSRASDDRDDFVNDVNDAGQVDSSDDCTCLRGI